MLERLMALLGLVDPGGDYDDEEEDDLRPDLEEREGRVLRPAAGEADLILLRGSSGPDRKEELAEALRKGKMLLVDLRGMEREPGQSLLDFLCGVACANRGTVLRVAGGIFLAAPRKTMIEEWEDENGA
jgi:cell division inhibitor SepF